MDNKSGAGGGRFAPIAGLTFSPVLPNTDTHRVWAVMEKSIERLQLLTLMNYEHKFSNSGGGGGAEGEESPGRGGNSSMQQQSEENVTRGVGSILEEQKRLEARYEALLVATQKVRPNPLDPQLDTVCFSHVENSEEKRMVEELQRISQQLKDQSKLLCRQLKDNPDDADNWRKVVGERSELITALSSCVRELSSSCTTVDGSSGFGPDGSVSQMCSYESFAKKVLDEQSAAEWADQLVRKERETNQNVKQLQNEVKFERHMKEEELEKRHKEIAALKTELRQLKQHVKVTMDKIRAETEASSEAQQRDAQENERQLTNEILSLTSKSESEAQVNGDFKNHVDVKTKHLDEELGKWQEKSNVSRQEKQNQKHHKERERTELAQTLKDRIDQLEAAELDKKNREEEIRRKTEDKGNAEMVASARFSSATKLQASVKGFFTRQTLVVLKKKMSKKKKS